MSLNAFAMNPFISPRRALNVLVVAVMVMGGYGVAPIVTTAAAVITPSPSVTAPTVSADPQPLPGDKIFTIGFIRVGADDLDSPNTLSSFLATMRYYNNHRLVRGVFFQLNVTTILCPSMKVCRTLTAPQQAQLDGFMAAMPSMSVVLKPNFLFANRIVDYAKSIGCPVVNPEDMRRQEAFRAGAETVIQFHQNWEAQGSHMFAYVQQTARCAYSAIAHDNNNLVGHNYYPQIALVQNIFTNGGYSKPPELDVSIADDAAFKEFFFSDSPRRRCFIMMGTNSVLMDTVKRLLATDWYVPANYRFVGFSTMGVDEYKINGSAAPFASTVFTSWIPTMQSDFFDAAYAEFVANPNPQDLTYLDPAERYTTTATFLTLSAYMMMRLTLETIRDAVGYATEGSFYGHYTNEAAPFVKSSGGGALNYPVGQPLSWAALLNSFYRHAREIDGYWFNHLVRECPRYPAEQLCFCNILTANSYIYNINTTTGSPEMVYDNILTGDRDIAAPSFAGQCGYQISAWAYPLTGLTLYPTTLIGRVGYRQEDVVRTFNEFQAVYGESIAAMNWAKVKPVRAMRYAAYNINDDEDPTKRPQHSGRPP